MILRSFKSFIFISLILCTAQFIDALSIKWTHTLNDQYAEPQNWLPQQVPGEFDDVNIISNGPLLTDIRKVRSLSIPADRSFTIGAGGQLTCTEGISVKGTFAMRANAELILPNLALDYASFGSLNISEQALKVSKGGLFKSRGTVAISGGPIVATDAGSEIRFVSSEQALTEIFLTDTHIVAVNGANVFIGIGVKELLMDPGALTLHLFRSSLHVSVDATMDMSATAIGNCDADVQIRVPTPSDLFQCDVCVDGILILQAGMCSTGSFDFATTSDSVSFDNVRVRVRGFMLTRGDTEKVSTVKIRSNNYATLKLVGATTYMEPKAVLAMFDNVTLVCDECVLRGCNATLIDEAVFVDLDEFADIVSSTFVYESTPERFFSVHCATLEVSGDPLRQPVLRAAQDDSTSLPRFVIRRLLEESGSFLMDLALVIQYEVPVDRYIMEVGEWRSSESVHLLIVNSVTSVDSHLGSIGTMDFLHPDSVISLLKNFQPLVRLDGVQLRTAGLVQLGSSFISSFKAALGLQLTGNASMIMEGPNSAFDVRDTSIRFSTTLIELEEGCVFGVRNGALWTNALSKIGGNWGYNVADTSKLHITSLGGAAVGGTVLVENATISLDTYDNYSPVLKIGEKDVHVPLLMSDSSIVLLYSSDLTLSGTGHRLVRSDVRTEDAGCTFTINYAEVMFDTSTVTSGIFVGAIEKVNLLVTDSEIVFAGAVRWHARNFLAFGFPIHSSFIFMPNAHFTANFSSTQAIMVGAWSAHSSVDVTSVPTIVFADQSQVCELGGSFSGPLDIRLERSECSLYETQLIESVTWFVDSASTQAMDISNLHGDGSSLLHVEGSVVGGNGNVVGVPWLLSGAAASITGVQLEGAGVARGGRITNCALWNYADLEALTSSSSNVDVMACNTSMESIPASLQADLGALRAEFVSFGIEETCCVRLSHSPLIFPSLTVKSGGHMLVGERMHRNARAYVLAGGLLDVGSAPANDSIWSWNPSLLRLSGGHIRLYPGVAMLGRSGAPTNRVGTLSGLSDSGTRAELHWFGPAEVMNSPGQLNGGESFLVVLHAMQNTSLGVQAREFSVNVQLAADAYMKLFYKFIGVEGSFTLLNGSMLYVQDDKDELNRRYSLRGPGPLRVEQAIWDVNGPFDLIDGLIVVDGGTLVISERAHLNCSNSRILVTNGGTLLVDSPEAMRGELEIEVSGERSTLRGSGSIRANVVVREGARVLLDAGVLSVNGSMTMNEATIINVVGEEAVSDSVLSVLGAVIMSNVSLHVRTADALSGTSDSASRSIVFVDSVFEHPIDCEVATIVAENVLGGSAVCGDSRASVDIASEYTVTPHTCPEAQFAASLEQCLVCVRADCHYSLTEKFTSVFGGTCAFAATGVVDYVWPERTELSIDSGAPSGALTEADCYAMLQPRCHFRRNEEECGAYNGLRRHFAYADSSRRCAWCETSCMTEAEALQSLCEYDATFLAPLTQASTATPVSSGLTNAAGTTTIGDTAAQESEGDLDAAVIATGVVGALIFLVLLATLILFLSRRGQRGGADRTSSVGSSARGSGDASLKPLSSLPSDADERRSVASTLPSAMSLSETDKSSSVPNYGELPASDNYAVGVYKAGSDYEKGELGVGGGGDGNGSVIYAEGELER